MPDVVTSAFTPFGEKGFSRGVANKLGMEVNVDFYTACVMLGMAFQVRAGTITTPLVGDVVLSDTAAEYCVDSPAGTTLIPVYNNISMRLLTGTLHEYAIKSVATASSAGTVFVGLPLRSAGPSGATAVAAVCTARVAAAGGVTVTGETATTTPRHWSWSNPAAGSTGALPTAGYCLEWTPRVPPILPGIRCLYVQIAATGTGPSYYANLDWIEIPTATLLG